MSDYTATTEKIRKVYARFPSNKIKANREARKQFDRWLAEVKAEAWDEGFTYGETYADNPYRQGEQS